jgi:hypothetical protein
VLIQKILKVLALDISHLSANFRALVWNIRLPFTITTPFFEDTNLDTNLDTHSKRLITLSNTVC